MKIKVTIKSGSKSDKILKKMIAEKAAFKEAVTTGQVSAYARQSNSKLATPIPRK